MADLKATLTDIAKAIVDSPDEVKVSQSEDDTERLPKPSVRLSRLQPEVQIKR